MRILQRYILIDFLTNFVVALAVFTGFMFLANLLRPLREGFSISQTIRFMHLYLPYVLTWSLPLSVLTAAVTSSAKLAETGELVAVQSSGILALRLFQPVLFLAITLCIFSLYANSSLIPYCRRVTNELRNQMLFEVARTRLIVQGDREVELATDKIAYKIYAEGVFESFLHSIVVSARLENGDVLVLHAKEAQFLDNRGDGHSGIRLLLTDGSTTLIENVQKKADRVVQPPPREWGWAKNRLTLFTSGNRDHIPVKDRDMGNLLRNTGFKVFSPGIDEEERVQMIEIHKRLSLSLASFLFAFLGAPLGMLSRRSNRLIGFALSLFLAVGVYYPMHLGGTILAKNQILVPWIDLWSPNLFFLFLGTVLWWSFVRA